MAVLTVIRSKDLDLRCWDPKLYLGLCHQCKSRKKCKIPENERKIIRNKVRKHHRLPRKRMPNES